MRAFWRSNLRGAPETSARTSSDESASTRVEPTPNGQVRDVEKTQELDDSRIPFLTLRTVVMAVCATSQRVLLHAELKLVFYDSIF